MRRQLKLIARALPRAATLLSTLRAPDVVAFAGHMIDAPDRKTPRFPAAKAVAVRAEIAQRLAQWDIGAGDLASIRKNCGAT